MSGTSYVLDSNIISYFLQGNRELISYFETPTIYISFITELELLSDTNLNKKELSNLQGLLETVYITEFNSTIKDYTIQIRKKTRIKLPDAIIAATSLFLGYKLVTSDSNFKKLSIPIIYYQHQP